MWTQHADLSATVRNPGLNGPALLLPPALTCRGPGYAGLPRGAWKAYFRRLKTVSVKMATVAVGHQKCSDQAGRPNPEHKAFPMMGFILDFLAIHEGCDTSASL